MKHQKLYKTVKNTFFNRDLYLAITHRMVKMLPPLINVKWCENVFWAFIV